MPTRTRAGAVIFAKDPQRLAAFYESVADLKRLETHEDHLELASADTELVLHGLPPAIAATIELSTPPRRREDTAMKLILWVRDLATAREAATAAGGVLDPEGAEWSGRGFRACDGHDPEGNVVQFRQLVGTGEVATSSRRPRARPRFTLELPLSPEQILSRVQARLAEKDAPVEGSVFRRTMLLTVRPEARHFWSPHLDVQLTDLPEGRTRLSALFAPHPQIWTSFVAVQLVFGLLSIGALIYLTSMLTLGRDPWLAAGLLGLMLFGGGFAYGAAYVGQGLGSEQMYELRAFLDRALERDK